MQLSSLQPKKAVFEFIFFHTCNITTHAVAFKIMKAMNLKLDCQYSFKQKYHIQVTFRSL